MGSSKQEKELHIAPMLHVTSMEQRAFMRILTKRAVLWSEMLYDNTALYSKTPQDFLSTGDGQRPVVLQIGSNDPDTAEKASVLATEEYEYDEINLNVGCPSNKVVKKSAFGAALMREPLLVKRIVESMKSNTHLPVSIKTRIDVVDKERNFDVMEFIETLQPVCKRFILHARPVHLNGINPRENRKVPPLNYRKVYEACHRFPDVDFYLNGGIHSLKQAKILCHGTGKEEHDSHTNTGHSVPCSICNAPYGSCVAPPMKTPENLRGVMMGRAAMDNPSIFWDVDRYFYGDKENPCRNRRQVLILYAEFLEKTYPRRCCDNDERRTFAYPPPRIEIDPDTYCSVCRPLYRPEQNSICDTVKTVNGVEENPEQIERRPTKFPAMIIGRALKPVPPLFNHLPDSRSVKRKVDDCLRDLTIRDCGPGFIVRLLVNRWIPNELLDQDFAKTEPVE